LKNRTHTVTAEVVVPDGGASGVICVQGGVTGGWSLYLHDGVPTYCYNFLGLQRFFVRGDASVAPGVRQVRMEFDYDGGGMAQGGTVRLYVDGQEVGSGRVDHTQPLVFSVDETFDLGFDDASSVSTDYTPQSSVFTGTVNWVELDVGDDTTDGDHYLAPEERYRVALAIQ
jgi:arylsulfatase